MTRRLLALAAAALVTAAPAAAQSNDAVVATMVGAADLCVRVFKGQATLETGLNSLGFDRTSSGGRVKPVGGALVAVSMGAGDMGGPIKLCEITANPALRDKTSLKSSLQGRAQTYSLPVMAAGPISGGGQMEGWANTKGQQLIVLAITDRPNNGKPTTSVSLIWR
jgi:hypothetical protein